MNWTQKDDRLECLIFCDPLAVYMSIRQESGGFRYRTCLVMSGLTQQVAEGVGHDQQTAREAAVEEARGFAIALMRVLRVSDTPYTAHTLHQGSQ